MPQSPIERWLDDERLLVIDDLEVKRLAGTYRFTPGQVRGLLARYGLGPAKLEAAAERLRRF